MLAHRLFCLNFQGVFCELPILLGWLRNDLPYLRRDEEHPLLRYALPSKYNYLWLQVQGVDFRFRLNAACSYYDPLVMAVDYPMMRLVAQEMFCSLERRGFQVEYIGNKLNWQG